jgi:hypothetical protein
LNVFDAEPAYGTVCRRRRADHMTDRSYHEDRAREELARAEEATDPAIAHLHRQLAALHRRRMMELVEAGDAGLNSAGYASDALASL